MLVKHLPDVRDGVFIEVSPTHEFTPYARCFRFDDAGNAEYALLADLTSSNPYPRWFGHCINQRQFTIV